MWGELNRTNYQYQGCADPRWNKARNVIFCGEAYDAFYHDEEIHPLFEIPFANQSMRVKQLGEIKHDRINAHDSRFVHSLASAACTTGSLVYLVNKGASELVPWWDAIIAHALFHDIGHGPYSHSTEYLLKLVTGVDHKERGIQLLDKPLYDNRTLSEHLAYHDIDSTLVKELMSGKHPASKIVADKTLGAEKIAYIERDVEKCFYPVQPPSLDSILHKLLYRDGVLGLEGTDTCEMRRLVENPDIHLLASELQRVYVMLYADLYLSPASLLLARHVQRATQVLLNAGIDGNTIWTWDDREFESYARRSGGVAEHEMALLEQEELTPPKIVWRLSGESRISRFSTERVEHVGRDEARAIGKVLSDPRRIAKVEDGISAMIGGQAYLTACPAPERFDPHPVNFFGSKEQYTLGDVVHDHSQTLSGIADRHWAIRLHTRAAVSNDFSKEVIRYLLEFK